MEEILKNKKTGWMKAKILALNPEKEELMDILGESEIDTPSYVINKRNGEKTIILDFYLSDNDDEIFKYTIYIDNNDRESKNSGAKLWINQIGDTQWSDNEDNLFDSFKNFEKIDEWMSRDGKLSDRYTSGAKPSKKSVYGTKKYHIAKNGEAELIHLIKNNIQLLNIKDTQTNLFVDINKILNEDISELKEFLTFEIPVFCAFAYITKEYEQKIYKEFLPLNMFKDMCADEASIYTQKPFRIWKDSFEYTKEGSYYNFGKLQNFKEEFLPKGKEINLESSDY